MLLDIDVFFFMNYCVDARKKFYHETNNYNQVGKGGEYIYYLIHSPSKETSCCTRILQGMRNNHFLQ